MSYISNSSALKIDATITKAEGEEILSAKIELKKGDFCLLRGAHFSGKSVLLKFISRYWPFGKGKVERPDHFFFLGKEPYIKDGKVSLAEVIFYPNNSENLDPKKKQRVIDMLAAFDLPSMIKQETSDLRKSTKKIKRIRAGKLLEEVRNWKEVLSDGPKQIVGVIAAMLKEPDLLLMDDALSSLNYSNKGIAVDLLKEHMKEKMILFVDSELASSLQTRSINLDRIKQKSKK